MTCGLVASSFQKRAERPSASAAALMAWTWKGPICIFSLSKWTA